MANKKIRSVSRKSYPQTQKNVKNSVLWIFLGVLLLAIPITLFLTQQNQDPRSEAAVSSPTCSSPSSTGTHIFSAAVNGLPYSRAISPLAMINPAVTFKAVGMAACQAAEFKVTVDGEKPYVVWDYPLEGSGLEIIGVEDGETGPISLAVRVTLARGRSTTLQFNTLSPNILTQSGQPLFEAISVTGASLANRGESVVRSLSITQHGRPFSGSFIFPAGSRFPRDTEAKFRLKLESSNGIPSTFTVLEDFTVKRADGEVLIYPDVGLYPYADLERSLIDLPAYFFTSNLPPGNYTLEGKVTENRTGIVKVIRSYLSTYQP